MLLLLFQSGPTADQWSPAFEALPQRNSQIAAAALLAALTVSAFVAPLSPTAACCVPSAEPAPFAVTARQHLNPAAAFLPERQPESRADGWFYPVSQPLFDVGRRQQLYPAVSA